MSTSSESKPMRLGTVKEACGYGKMGRTKLYEKINEGAIVAFTRGNRTFVDLDSIDAMNARALKPWKPGKKMPDKKGRRRGARVQ
ncbi:hypothetical protein [Bradyrhizobium sp. STM 3562]|uniref:hypothetical protein n=1 Tax=Bradyrhizobium sp. STM 3562 TaxID=578924 RepID=UPI00388EE4B6